MSTYPPDGYEVESGAWGTDIDVNTNSSYILSGDKSIEFKNTNPGGNVALRSSANIPVEPYTPYQIFGSAYASRINAGDIVFVGIEWYTVASVYISTSFAHYAILAAATTWYELASIFQSPATARFARPVFGKAGVDFTTYFDAVYFSEMPICFMVYLSSSQSLANGDTIPFDTEDYDYGDNYDTGTYRFTAPSTGIYAIGAGSYITGHDDGEYVVISVYKNGNYWISIGLSEGGKTGALVAMSGGIPGALLSRGDYIEIKLGTDEAPTVTVTGHATFHYSWFSVAKVE